MPSTFYIYGKFYDKDSGVQSIEVSESLKGKVDGVTDYKETVTVYDWKSADVKFKRDDNGWNSFVLKYTMQESLKEKVAIIKKKGQDCLRLQRNFPLLSVL